MEFVDVQDTEIPALGFGTWMMKGKDCRDGVEHALSLGYRHIDTAQAYDNEEQVGRALNNSIVDRHDIFLTTKVWRSNFAYDDAGPSIDESLQKLDTDYVDLLLIHWPDDEIPAQETLRALREAQTAGKARHIGVSNYTPTQVRNALEHADLLCNQVEYHPFLGQQDLLDLLRDNDMMLTAYSPLARGRVLDDNTLTDIGDQYGKSPAQVALRWAVEQPNVCAIPKASSPEHREANLDIFDFELSDEDIARIAELERGQRILDPDFAPDWENA